MKMNKPNSIVTFALLAAGIIALAPSASADDYIVATDNAYETEYNPYAAPINIQNWLWDLTWHHKWTNAWGYASKNGKPATIEATGVKKFFQQCRWFLGTNTFYTTTDSKGGNDYIAKACPNHFNGNTKLGLTATKYTPPDETCLAKIENKAKPTADSYTDPETPPSEEQALAIMTVAATQLFRPHESNYDTANLKAYPNNAAFMSNLVVNTTMTGLDPLQQASYETYWKSNRPGSCMGSWQCGQSLDANSFLAGPKYISFTNTWSSVNDLARKTRVHYGKGIDACIAYLDKIPDYWEESCELPGRTNEVALVDKNAVWRWFDTDVHVDRGDVLMLKFFCYMSKVLLLIPEAYELEGDNQYERPRLNWVQEDIFSIGEEKSTNFYPYKEYGDPTWLPVKTRTTTITRQNYNENNPFKLPYDNCFYGARTEMGFWSALHKLPHMFSKVEDQDAAKAAKDAFTKALECYLDADAYITGQWPSFTGSEVGGQRTLLQDEHHLIEMEDITDEMIASGAYAGDKGNATAWRQVIRTLYASMTKMDVESVEGEGGEKGTGTTAQNLDLNKLVPRFDLTHQRKPVDFSGLGLNKDGIVQIDATKVFEGGLTPTNVMRDVNKAVGLYTNDTQVFHGKYVWVEPMAYGGDKRTNDTEQTFTFVKTRFTVNEDTVNPTLGGLVPDGTAIDGLKLMATRYAMRDGGLTEFAEHFYDDRTSLGKGQTTNLVENKVYTAAPTTEDGGVFYLKIGATLTGTNVKFEGNQAANGGAINNYGGTVALKDATFTRNKSTTENGGAILNADTLSLDGVTFEGNTAGQNGGAIYNGGTVNFDGPVMLVTTNDTIYNQGTLNWNLAGGKQGFLDGYQNITCAGSKPKLQLTVGEYPAYPANVVIATGEFSGIAAAKTDTFSLTNVLGGAALTGLKIDGAEVADELMSYQLATEEDAESGTTNLVLKVVLLTTCEREEIKAGDTKTLEEGFTYKAAPTEDNGGAFNLKGGAALTGADVAFESNAAAIGGAIYSDGGTVALTNATFTGNKSAQGGGAIYNAGTVALTNATFTGNEAATGGAIRNTGTVSLGGVTFEGNKAKYGGAIFNDSGSTLHFDGAVTLVTETDTIYNTGMLNWNLADGKQGLLNGYDKISNDGGTLQLTVGDYPAYPTNFVIATGDFSNTTGKDTFKIKPGDVKVTINGSGVATGTEPGNMLYRLVTEGTNLVLQVYEITCERKVVTTSPENPEDVQSPYALTNGFTYTAKPSTASGGAFKVNPGATLAGTNATFAANETLGLGGAIDNRGRVSLKDTVFTGNKAAQGGAIYNAGGTVALTNAVFTGNKAKNGGAIYNSSGTVHFDGAVTLVTTNDTICNYSTLNWNLADGKQGVLNGYQNITNSGDKAKLKLTVEDYATATNFTLATGNFSNIKTANTEKFSISPLGKDVMINGGTVVTEDGSTGYRLVTEEAGATTNLVLKITLFTCKHTVVTGTTNLVEGTTYTAAPATDFGGAFLVNGGATLTGANVTFAGNETTQSGGAIYNAGTVALTNATFTGNKATQEGGAICNDVTLSLDGVTFEGNTAAKGGAIYNFSDTVHFDGPVMLVTETDTIYNVGTLNWNLAGGKHGLLNGYDKLTNKGTLQLTVEDYATTTNFTLATGNFSNIATAKTDTFSITNVAGGAALPDVKIDGDTVISTDGWYGYQLVTKEDLSVPTTNLVLKVTKYTCVRTELNSGDSTNLVEGTSYTAAPATDKEGGVFLVYGDAMLTGTDVTFADNEANYGGAIYNGGTVALTNAVFMGNKAAESGGAIGNAVIGTLSLDGVTFEGNTAKRGGAIYNFSGTVHFDGAVTLVTTNDTIYNYKGTLNWNLAGGKQGFLGGYDKLTNKGKLQLTVEDYVTAATNFVIATGDFSEIADKDTFLMTNVTGGVTATIKIGGITQLNGTWWSLEVEKPLKLKKALKAAAAETSRLVLATVPADDLVQLTNVEIVDKETGATSATAVVKAGDIVVKQNPDGSYTVPKGYALTVVYTTTDDYMFGPGWTQKTVELGELEGDTSMNDEPYASLKPSTQEKWVDVREIAVDTRERIVVGSPNEVLPLAYSTNGWGAVKYPQMGPGNHVVTVSLSVNGKLEKAFNDQSGYYEWMPETGAYGAYDIEQAWFFDGIPFGSTNATIYYAGYYPLTLVKPKNGTYEAKVAGVAITNGTPVLGYEYVNLKATPTYDNANRYEFVGWAATTGGVVFAEGFTNTATAVTRFEMPLCAAAIAAGFQWKSNYNEQVAVKQGESWQVFAGETYSNATESAMKNLGHAYGSDATFIGSKTDAAGSAVYTEGTFAFTNVTFQYNETTGNGGALYLKGATGILVRCRLDTNKASSGGAIYNEGGRLTLEDCFFIGNQATVGGALYNYAGAEAILRGMTKIGTNVDTVFNGGRLVWDFTDGSVPCFGSYKQFTNDVEGTLWIQTVDDENAPDDLKTNVYTIAMFVNSTAGKDTFTVTNDFGSVKCTIYTGTDPDEGWAYLGSKRYRLTVDKGGILRLAVEWGAFDAIFHYDASTVETNRFYVNKGMVLPTTNWHETLPPVPLDDAWFGEARKTFVGWITTNEYYDAAGDLLQWADADEGKIDYYQTGFTTNIPPMTLGDQEFWARWSYTDMWYAGVTNATGEITDMVMAELVEWTGEMKLMGTFKGRSKMQDCVDPKWEDPLTAPWYWGHRPYINLLTVDKNVVYLGSYAFYDCHYLREVFFEAAPEGGTNVFEGCSAAVGYYNRAFEDTWTNRLVNGKWKGLTMYCREDVPTFDNPNVYVMMDVNGKAVLTVADGTNEVACTSNPKGYVIVAPNGVTVKDAAYVPAGRAVVKISDLEVGSDRSVTFHISGTVAPKVYGKKSLNDKKWDEMAVKTVTTEGDDTIVTIESGDYRFFTLDPKQ